MTPWTTATEYCNVKRMTGEASIRTVTALDVVAGEVLCEGERVKAAEDGEEGEEGKIWAVAKAVSVVDGTAGGGCARRAGNVGNR